MAVNQHTLEQVKEECQRLLRFIEQYERRRANMRENVFHPHREAGMVRHQSMLLTRVLAVLRDYQWRTF